MLPEGGEAPFGIGAAEVRVVTLQDIVSRGQRVVPAAAGSRSRWCPGHLLNLEQELPGEILIAGGPVPAPGRWRVEHHQQWDVSPSGMQPSRGLVRCCPAK
jgi:hypothetical protein